MQMSVFYSTLLEFSSMIPYFSVLISSSSFCSHSRWKRTKTVPKTVSRAFQCTRPGVQLKEVGRFASQVGRIHCDRAFSYGKMPGAGVCTMSLFKKNARSGVLLLKIVRPDDLLVC